MSDQEDKKDALAIAVVLTVLALVIVVVSLVILPAVSEIVKTRLEPGLGVKDSALIAFFVSLLAVIILAVFAGDGLIGELQFIIPGFFMFYLVIWLQLAWIF
jgi:hypothetical protein